MDKEQLRPVVEAARAGDADAFAALYADFYKALYKTAYYLLGQPQDAEDTVMETFADAFAGVRRLRAPDAFEGWLYRILYNKARRKRGAAALHAADELSEHIEAAGRTDREIAAGLDLLRALDTLSREERAIVVFAVCEGYTSGEVARMMGMNPNTVRSKQLRALAKLRARLEEGESK